MNNVISWGLALAIFVGCSFLSEMAIKMVSVSTNMSDIASTKVKFFESLPKF